MDQFGQFNSGKEAILGTLEQLRCLLVELGEIGADVAVDLEKIAAAVKSIELDVLRIALLGAFSDGKTSVVAAWLGRVMDNMKIDMDESSDQLAVYCPEGLPDQCEIVDTPGLFGDKARAVDGTQVMYEDVTKRYISEAHLILYVVDATNPLKDSHGSIVRWLLRDLDKLSSTVFVINKMDEVTDLTEQDLFAQQATIKKENLKSKLLRVANLSAVEAGQLNIVCIASNPNGRGLEFWFSKRSQYEERSRINDLKAETSRILDASVPAVLVAKTGLDVVRDIVGKKVLEARAQLDDLRSYEQRNREESTRIRKDLVKARGEVKRLGGELFDELQNLERQLLGKLRPLAIEDIRGYLEDEIGYSEEAVGYKMNLKIKMAVDRFFAQASNVAKTLALDIERELDSSQSFLEAMSGKAARGAGNALQGLARVNPEALKGAILAARDVLGKVTGITIKFKPWGVTNLAGAAKFAPAAGLAIQLASDAWELMSSIQREEKLKEIKEEINGMIKSSFKNVYEIIAHEEKLFECFAPELAEFDVIIQGMEEAASVIESKRLKVAHLEERMSVLRQAASRPQVL
ncbi:LeoA/HP0731 family dynamin-like GTPase [Zavarzinia aquatilis]|uniref:GTP-binding protein n=1 Tax=Zavarzinia aquatilis TaxID=2211142 RepID=A0A317E1Y7_9PROT|nr:LeoA/HP0731 family dynamin-like GTPase [Zavarzinia aquatilis]PWR21098.1 GTP-binding protein [Zavarzinia aquatilis]